MTPAANGTGGVERRRSLGEPVIGLRTRWAGAADSFPDKEFGSDAESVDPVPDPATGGEQKLAWVCDVRIALLGGVFCGIARKTVLECVENARQCRGAGNGA